MREHRHGEHHQPDVVADDGDHSEVEDRCRHDGGEAEALLPDRHGEEQFDRDDCDRKGGERSQGKVAGDRESQPPIGGSHEDVAGPPSRPKLGDRRCHVHDGNLASNGDSQQPRVARSGDGDQRSEAPEQEGVIGEVLLVEGHREPGADEQQGSSDRRRHPRWGDQHQCGPERPRDSQSERHRSRQGGGGDRQPEDVDRHAKSVLGNPKRVGPVGCIEECSQPDDLYESPVGALEPASLHEQVSTSRVFMSRAWCALGRRTRPRPVRHRGPCRTDDSRGRRRVGARLGVGSGAHRRRRDGATRRGG